MKLIAVVFALAVSVCVVMASSYAWMVLSSSPAVSGIQVGIGGGNTVLIAPDIKEVADDGSVYHYPGRFTDKMNFGSLKEYEYLWQVGNLNPVSTVNGVDWILPSYYTGSDAKVQQGIIPSGTLKDVSEFVVDSELEYANLKPEDEDRIEKGHYIYMDFWVLSPANEYKLRVSTGVNELDGGSFVIDLLQPEKSEDTYTLKASEGSAASAVRIGFLANDLMMTDDTMAKYVASPYFDDRFSYLKGFYQEPNTGTAYIDANRFVIYEPNGDFHPLDPALDGTYVETMPLGLQEGSIVEKRAHVEGNEFLTVQRKTDWLVPLSSESSAIEQRFQTALAAGSWDDLTADQMTGAFYGKYLQGQIAPYVTKGSFVQWTDDLYQSLNGVTDGNGVTLTDETIGATDDVYIIELERNVPQRIRMFIWLEGQDMDCIEHIAATRFAVNIELACGDE